MALVVTGGSATANSYVTVAEADAYIALLPYADVADWAGLETAPKEYRLKLAALVMNSLAYRGAKACMNQRLAFPRWWRTEDDYPDDEDTYEDMSDITDAGLTAPTVSQEVKDAQCEVAFQVIHTVVLKADVMAAPEKLIKAFGLGGGSLTIEFGADSPGRSLFDKSKLATISVVAMLLSRWVKQIGGVVV